MLKHRWDDQIFVLDSETIEQATTRLCGYCVWDGRLIEQHTLSSAPDFQPSGLGCYVYVRRQGRTVTIHQDFIGCFGLYLFQDGDYFAISNSFALLVDHLKTRRPLTFHAGYADQLLAAGLVSLSYNETMIREITLIDRSDMVEIDLDRRAFTLRGIDYRENSVELNSGEGMAVLDGWFRRWTAIIRNLKAQSDNLVMDLSGGIDSRLILLLMLTSGIDLNDVHVISLTDHLHTHREDFQIASSIAERYHFKLNDDSMLRLDSVPLPMEEIVGASFYSKLGFHKQMYFHTAYHRNAELHFAGSGGECIRSYWNKSPSQYVDQETARADPYPWPTSWRMAGSIREILDTGMARIMEKYHVEDEDSPQVTALLYRNIRNRYHFGGSAVEDYFSNCVKLMPLLDPELHRLKLNDAACPDANLLVALIYTRYCPGLLAFPFDGGRRFAEDTLRYAAEISARYPCQEAPVSPVERRTKERPELATKQEKAPHSLDDVCAWLKGIFLSPGFRLAFELLYGSAIYTCLLNDVEKRAYHALSPAYAAMAIVRFADDARLSRKLANAGLSDYFPAFLTDSTGPDAFFDEPEPEDHSAPLPARIDVKNFSQENQGMPNDLDWRGMSDRMATIKTPEWFKTNGIGYVVESGARSVRFEVRCIGEGRLRIALLTPNVTRDGVRVRNAVEYTRLTVNGQERLKEPKAAWHDEPFVQVLNVADQETVHVEIAWREHQENAGG